MNDPVNPAPGPTPEPAAPPPPALPPASGSPSGGPPPPEKSRKWFVVLAWVTLILFGIFVAGITVLSVRIPELKKTW